MNKLEKLVYEFPTKDKMGFSSSEQKEILENFLNINMEKYYDALMGVTCISNDEDEIIIYHCDIYKALQCGIENRDLYNFEWD